jgi:adenylate cyclase
VLLNDLLDIADNVTPLPAIESDARGRRLTGLLNATAMAREEPALYIVEDVHWIDDASEAMFAEFTAVIERTRSIMLVSYRPEYSGALAHAAGAQTITLRPLNNAQTSSLIDEVLGPDPSVRRLADKIADRAAGNPYFVAEIVRDLAERGLLQGERGDYTSCATAAEVSVPCDAAGDDRGPHRPSRACRETDSVRSGRDRDAIRPGSADRARGFAGAR